MKYWRGYLTAAIFAAFTFGLMQFAKAHTQIVDMVYPYLTRMMQTTLAEWSSGASVCVWQVVLALLIVGAVASIVLMIVLRWNPIQWFGWVAAVVSVVFFLHTAFYGLNTYAGPLAEDLHLEVSEYTLDELKTATAYYRDQANALSGQVARNADGSVDFPDFDTLAAQAGDGFHSLVYDSYYPVFAGSTLPVKQLGWADMYTKMGISGVTIGLTGEAAVNPQTPAVALPFTMCHEMAHRMSIAVERDANFSAFLACRANADVNFRYSAFFMAYRYCYNAMVSAGASAEAQQVAAGLSERFARDLADYRNYYNTHQDQKATQTANKVNDTYIKASGDEKGIASYGDVCDLLVNLYIKEFVAPTQVDDEPKFDPFDKTQVDVSDILGLAG